jgi:hypothetical protein
MVGSEIQIMIRETGSNEVWGLPKKISTKDLSFQFIRFFQWDQYTFRDLPMVRCKVMECFSHPEYIGREALVDNYEIDFYYAEAPAAQSAEDPTRSG